MKQKTIVVFARQNNLHLQLNVTHSNPTLLLNYHFHFLLLKVKFRLLSNFFATGELHMVNHTR